MKYNWNVLIVDDEWSERYILKQHLKDLLHKDKIVECETISEAVDHIKNGKVKFDLIISDLHLPERTGMDFIVDDLLTHDWYKTVPVIVTTNAFPDSLLTKVMKPLVFDFLLKPVKYEVLEETFEKVNKHYQQNPN